MGSKSDLLDVFEEAVLQSLVRFGCHAPVVPDVGESQVCCADLAAVDRCAIVSRSQ